MTSEDHTIRRRRNGGERGGWQVPTAAEAGAERCGGVREQDPPIDSRTLQRLAALLSLAPQPDAERQRIARLKEKFAVGPGGLPPADQLAALREKMDQDGEAVTRMLATAKRDAAAYPPSLLQAAYELGRQVRETELRALHDASVGLASSRGATAQPGGRKRGEVIAAQAQAWSQPASEWAQQILDRGRLALAKPTRYALAVYLADHWNERPFRSEPVRPDRTTGPPSIDNLARRIIPGWRLRWPAQQ